MLFPRTLSLALLAGYSYAYTPSRRSYDIYDYYSIERVPSGASLADISEVLGVEVVERVGELRNHWLVRASRAALEARELDDDPVIRRWKALRSESAIWGRSEVREVAASVKNIARQIPRQRVKRAPPPIVEEPSSSTARAVAERLGIQDPLFTEQWHLVNGEYPEHMMNVTGVWEMGFTGKGIITSLVDDGLDYTSLDLKDNFDADDSYDFNDHEYLPTPKLSDDTHGTRCAGQVAAGKNSACGVGIAYESRVAGVRILSGEITDVDEAAALNYGYQNVSIYSCSWGPPDNGEAMEGPSDLIRHAVLNGINEGRGGKGSIFVFASGNGASHGDSCNFDGYTNSIYSVTVSAVDHKGLHPYYSEPCAANMIVAYSSGSGKHIVTTDKGENSCSYSHGGTSAAAPNAAGVFALAVQARPDLTWRDIQHLCVETARMINLDDSDWEITATGRFYSYKYGFGVLDGYRYVKAAQDWELVKPQTWFKTHSVVLNDGAMTEEGEYSGGEFIVDGGVTSSIEITDSNLKDSNFEKLEHINIRVWIQHGKRGDVEVEIVSPNGVKSVLATARKADKDTTGFPGWVFMTVKHWGENPVGLWTIRVSDQNEPGSNGTFLGWNMILWGSTIDPLQAKTYELPPDEAVFPPSEDIPVPTASPTTTKVISKPTVPPHPTSVNAETSSSSTSTPSATQTPTGVGWFPGMANLSSNTKWFFGAAAAVVIFGLAATGFFLWRRRRQRKSEYTTLPGDEMRQSGGMGTPMLPRNGTRELYDAFGEVSDDEDYADEETHLRAGHREMVSEGIGFHSGFLDDDEPPTAAADRYRDDDPVDETRTPDSVSSGRPQTI